jgi:mycothiol synthase
MKGLRSLPARPSYSLSERARELQHQLEMVRPSSKGGVDVAPVPEGYFLRQFCAGDETQYDDLFHLAFEDADRFAETQEQALSRGFFVVEHVASGELVASCVAMRGTSSPRHRGAGQLGWLVTDPSHIGQGLGTIASASVTNRLFAEGYSRPFLGTEDFRLAAISIYLKLGWCPYIYCGGMEARWRTILSRLNCDCELGFVYST